MRTSQAPNSIIHEVLRGQQNYEIWWKAIKTYLIAEDLWDAIEGRLECEPGDYGGNFKTWQTKNARALRAIYITCEPSIARSVNIEDFKSAKELWSELKKAFGSGEDTRSAQEEPAVHASLCKAVDRGNWTETADLVGRDRALLGAPISHGRKTVLHLAVTAEHFNIVKQLLDLPHMTNQILEAQEADGYTALAIAARGGSLDIAELLIRKHEGLVLKKTERGELPILLASAIGHVDMTRFLYKTAPILTYDWEKDTSNGASLLTNCIAANIFDVALNLLQRCKRLALCPDSEGRCAVHVLAQMTNSFSSGDNLKLWERWIYSSIREIQPASAPSNSRVIQMPNESGGSNGTPNQNPSLPEIQLASVPSNSRVIQMPNESAGSNGTPNQIPSISITQMSNGSEGGSRTVNQNQSDGGNFIIRCKKRMEERKLIHTQARELLRMVFEEISALNSIEFKNSGIIEDLFLAVENGIIEFVTEALESDPDILWSFDKHGRSPFHYAVLQRQEKIFNLIYEKGSKKSLVVGYPDKLGNNMLHHAATLAPSFRLSCQPGAALQFQRELQWFEEVEKLVPPRFKESRNFEGRTPHELFTLQHANLLKQGEKWMKDTAQSGTIVATLIATMMFGAAFTIPGGNDQNEGFVLFLKHGSAKVIPFMIFIIADIVSLVSATTAVLMFLGILTTRYGEKDFLKSLPRKIILSLAALFLSVTAMMIAFGATIYMILHKRLGWGVIPVVAFGALPIVVYLVSHFRLLYRMISSTYRPSTFNKKKIRG